MRQCSVEGCGGKHLARGFCRKHYARWKKHGDPSVVLKAKRPALRRRYLEQVVATRDTHDCIIWPYGRSSAGYGKLGVHGRSVEAHVYVMQLKTGRSAPPGKLVAHSCGNRACFNPRHLRYATVRENSEDAICHGTTTRGSRQPHAKLDEDAVRDIRRAIARGEVQARIAERHGVSSSTIAAIKSGANWGWLE